MSKARRQEIQNPIEDINDICGIRIICLFRSDLKRLGQIIQKAFQIERIDDKVVSKAQDHFGYFSVHYLCRLNEACAGPRYDNIKELLFEIQLRTIAMHAWATISHYLDYKSPETIPSELRKDFNALSGLFYIADSHFELFFRASADVRKEAEQRIKGGSDLSHEEVNLDTMTIFLHEKYPKRKHAPPKIIAELVEEIAAAGYTSLAEVERDLDKAENAFNYYEANFPPSHGVYADVGVVRSALSIVNDIFLKKRQPLSKTMIEGYRQAREYIN